MRTEGAEKQEGAGDSHPQRSERISALYRELNALRTKRIPVSVRKAQIVTESFKSTEGQAPVIRVAKALAAVLEQVPVLIDPRDLLLGNLSCKPGGVELSCLWATWGVDELDALNRSGFAVDREDYPLIEELNAYWAPRSLTSRMTSLYDDKHLWPYAQLGVVLPPFRNKEEGWGPGGMVGPGWGIHHEISQIIFVPDYERVLREGLGALLLEAEAELSGIRLTSEQNIRKSELLRAVIISLSAVINFSARLAKTALAEAELEQNAARREELKRLAECCYRVPTHPARSFVEALQSLWIVWSVLLPAGILSFGRLDKLLGRYLEDDLAASRLSEAEALEYLQWLRIKDSEIVVTSGQTHRSKYGGLAKWHNCTLGGQNSSGEDETNIVTYLLLKAARTCPAPHPTLTLRVHEKTPDKLLDQALELVGTGVGLPSLISDKSCIEYFLRHGVPADKAVGYGLAGCLGVNIVGASRMVASPMFVAPLVLKFALYGGVDIRTGEQVGPKTKRLDECETFEEFCGGLERQIEHFVFLQAEFNNVTIHSYRERFPQPFESALTEGGLQAAENILGRTMPYENGSAVNPIGIINVADSLAAIRQLVFEQRSVKATELLNHLQTNWEGPAAEAVRKLALAAPKFGNDDDYVDAMAARLYDFFESSITRLTTSYGGYQKASALTIGTCVKPAGVQAGATPDGRRAEDSIADEAVSPMRGCDRAGVKAALKSALKVDQAAWQSLSMDLRISPELLRSPQQRKEVAELVRWYFLEGGKHIQFNAIEDDKLRAAQQRPEAFEDLIVRIGGCSAYFVQLPKEVQDEIMRRSEVTEIN